MAEESVPRKRISRPHDLRAVKSREALRGALLHLIQSRPLEQITIREITIQAGVSYPVFFRQFAGKDELLADVATEEVRRLLGHTHPMMDGAAPRSSLVDMCNYVQAHRPLWKALLTAGAAAAMRSEFARIAAEIGNRGPRANPWLPVELASAFVASGIFEILAWWLNQPEDYPVRNVVKLLDALIARPIAMPQNVRLD